jgi:hypothetical protein
MHAGVAPDTDLRHLRAHAQIAAIWAFLLLKIGGYQVARPTSINVRLEAGERERLERLAGCAGLSISNAVRALVRSAEQITPARPATAVFNDNGAGSIRQDSPRAVVA